MARGELSPETHSAEEVVRQLRLQPLDREGGYFRRTLESAVILPGLDRRATSAIFMLLTPEGFSALHRLRVDETWCYHAGDAAEGLRLYADGTGARVRLGADVGAGELLQELVPAGTWQGTRLAPGGRWALFSCVVAPEFRWEDFDLADRAALTANYPAFAPDIHALTRLEPPAGSR